MKIQTLNPYWPVKLTSFAFDIGTSHCSAFALKKGFFPTRATEPYDKTEPGVGNNPFNEDLHEPLWSVMIREKYKLDGKERKIIAIGQQAYDRWGRTPPHHEALWALEHGRMQDSDVVAALMDEMVNNFHPGFREAKRLTAPELVISAVPQNATPMEISSMWEVIYRTYTPKQVAIVSEAAMAMLGIGLKSNTSTGVYDIGAGTADFGLLAGDEVNFTASFPIGGNLIDHTIQDKVLQEKSLIITLQDAELVKRKLAFAVQSKIQISGTLRGADRYSGRPREIEITTQEVTRWIQPVINQLAESLNGAWRDVTEAQIASDIQLGGIALTGRGSKIHGLPKFLREKTGLKIKRAPKPGLSVILGLRHLLENPELVHGFDLYHELKELRHYTNARSARPEVLPHEEVALNTSAEPSSSVPNVEKPKVDVGRTSETQSHISTTAPVNGSAAHLENHAQSA